MYKAMSKHIIDDVQKGYALLPTEGETTLLNKVPFRNFLAVDYRYSNNVLVEGDKESVVEPYQPNLTHESNYVMGFAVVRNPSAIAEFSQSSRATTTRVRNKTIETLASVLSDVRIPKNRGRRSVFIERERKDGFADIDSIMKAVGLNPATQASSEYLVLPFFVSTTVYFNNFRAKVGVGNSWNGPALITDDAMRRLPKAFEEIEEKFNRRLSTPLTSSLFVGFVLASAKHICDDSVYVSSLLDYASEVHPTADPSTAPAGVSVQVAPVVASVVKPTVLGANQAKSLRQSLANQASATLPKPTYTQTSKDDDNFTVNPDTGEIIWH